METLIHAVAEAETGPEIEHHMEGTFDLMDGRGSNSEAFLPLDWGAGRGSGLTASGSAQS